MFSRQKQTSEKNFWIKTNVTSIPMKFEALLGLLASLYKSRVWRYVWNDTSRRVRKKNKTLDLKNHSEMKPNALVLFWIPFRYVFLRKSTYPSAYKTGDLSIFSLKKSNETDGIKLYILRWLKNIFTLKQILRQF